MFPGTSLAVTKVTPLGGCLSSSILSVSSSVSSSSSIINVSLLSYSDSTTKQCDGIKSTTGSCVMTCGVAVNYTILLQLVIINVAISHCLLT
jgi:hypothetical protein